MSEQFVILISFYSIFNLSLLTVLSWIKSKNHPSYLWLGCMFAASALAILLNVMLFMDTAVIWIYHLSSIANVLWGSYLWLFVRHLRYPLLTKIIIPWKLFIPAFLYLPVIVICLADQQFVHETLSMVKTGRITTVNLAVDAFIFLYSFSINIALLIQEHSHKIKHTISAKQSRMIRELLWFLLLLNMLAFLPVFYQIDIKYIIMFTPIFGQALYIYMFFRLIYGSKMSFEIEKVEKVKYAGLHVNRETTDEIKDQILNYIESNKCF